MPLVDLTKFNGVPVGSIVFRPAVRCTLPICSICNPALEDADGGGLASMAHLLDDEYENTSGFFPTSNTERVTDLEEEVQNLRAAVLDLTQVVEYLLIWTGKKGNKMDRDKYLNGYIDPIRVII
jgi:hypothetical protein